MRIYVFISFMSSSSRSSLYKGGDGSGGIAAGGRTMVTIEVTPVPSASKCY